MRFNFGEEEFVEDVTKLWAILATIRCEIIEAKVIEKPSNKKKRKVDNLKAPIDLEDFDYIIPHLPSTEDILKVIIKKHDMTNDKIDFITRDFIKDPTHLPREFVLDDDFDEV